MLTPKRRLVIDSFLLNSKAYPKHLAIKTLCTTRMKFAGMVEEYARELRAKCHHESI